MVEKTPPADVSVDIPVRSRWRVLYRVPVHLRKENKHIYDPVMVSIGPYHHGRDPQLQLAEQLKNETVDTLCSGAKDKGFLLSKISERLDEIRHFYCGAVRYSDQELAEMMLRDVCLVLYSMKQDESIPLILRRLGMSGAMFMYRDVYMLENQIPLWLINLLISLVYEGELAQSLLCNYLSFNTFGDQRMKRLPWGEEEEPLHLLEAVHRFYLLHLVETKDSRRLIDNYSHPRKQNSLFEIINSPFRSVTDLKAKGIHFRRSSQCLTDIKFVSFAFYAQLHLPIFCVEQGSIVILSNLIAFETSPDTETDYGVTSYIGFMKTLIDKASDVKELREKEILCTACWRAMKRWSEFSKASIPMDSEM